MLEAPVEDLSRLNYGSKSKRPSVALRKVAMIGGLSLLLLSQSAAQSPPPPRQADANLSPVIIACPIPIVLIEVEVRDRDGNEVVDLWKDDFRVYEDGVRQRLDYWRRRTDSEMEGAGARYEMFYYTPPVVFEGEYRSIDVFARGKDKKRLKVKYSPKGYFATAELFK